MLNYWPIIGVTVLSYIILAIWYSPLLFAKLWAKLTKVKDMKMGPAVMILGLVFMFISIVVLAFIINSLGVQGFVNGSMIGVILWIGFIVPFMINEVFYEKRSLALYLLNITSYLVILFIAGGLLAVWQ